MTFLKRAKLVIPGNIDLTNRKIIVNPDGSYSTVNTYGINHNGLEYNIPGVDAKKRLSLEEAKKLFLETGKHLGAYTSIDEATKAAVELHNQQHDLYKDKAKHLFKKIK